MSQAIAVELIALGIEPIGEVGIGSEILDAANGALPALADVIIGVHLWPVAVEDEVIGVPPVSARNARLLSQLLP